MPLAPGVRVGPYEVVAPLGEGGMGQVWRARDLRLPREVAIKVLPDAVAADPERLARFDRESAILATLSHPHIATILGIEDGPFGRAIVMELVSGVGLDARLLAGPLPVAEALTLARDVADALESAHEHGVVHRDLKPANLKLTADGRVKVLDFGLARSGAASVVSSSSRSPTALGATEAGTLLGTAAYMSPEQARGEPVDRRADIWAFGCVLYEALTAHRPFGGRSVADVLGGILHSDPDWSLLPEETPASVKRLLRRCLRKDARSRLRDIGDARLILEDVIAGEAEPAPPPAARGPRTHRLHLAWGLTALAMSALAAFVGYRARAGGAAVPLRKLEILVADPLVSTTTRPQLAPAGDAIVYAAGDRLWIRRFDQTDSREVPGSRLAERPFWSPDGSELAFAVRGRLWKAGANGGDAVPVCDLPGTGRIIAGAWRPDGTIVFSAYHGSIYSVPANGGDSAVFYEDRSAVDFHEITLLPDGRTLLTVPHTAVAGLSEIAALRDGTRRTLLPARPRSQVDMPRYSPTGHLLFVRMDVGEGVWALPFDAERLATLGEPFRVVAGSWVADVAAGGTLAYTSPGVQHQLVWLDRTGALQATVGPPQWVLADPAISPDARRVAIAASETAFTQQNLRKVWVFDIASGRPERLPLTAHATDEGSPEWSPDGSRLVYVDGRQRPAMLFWRGVDDGSLPQPLTHGGRPSFSPDGRTIAFTRSGDRGTDIWSVALSPRNQAEEPSILLDDAGNEQSPRFSPDGRFLAYVSDESGRPEIYVRRFPLTAERWVVSRGGGSDPRWSRASSELFYRSREGSIMAAPVSLRPGFQAGEPQRLFEESLTPGSLSRAFDVAADGQRFLAVRRASGSTGRIIVVQNWLSEFTR